MLSVSFNVADPRWREMLKTRRPAIRTILKQALQANELPHGNFSVSLSFVNDDEIRELNKNYRQKDKPTNVLSFPMVDDFSQLEKISQPIELGDIILAYETVAREAAEQEKPVENHMLHLLVHGMLHLFHYDHMNPEDESEMEALEIGILKEAGIPDPYA